MDRGAWGATVHRVKKNQKRLIRLRGQARTPGPAKPCLSPGRRRPEDTLSPGCTQ